MNFKRNSAPEDSCFYCRDFCGKPNPREKAERETDAMLEQRIDLIEGRDIDD